MVVNNWVKRFQSQGIEGLRTKPGRGRKPILDAEKDLSKVKAAVKANRQRISLVKADLEAALSKSFSQKTLQRYIKNMVRAISESESAPQRSRARKLMS
jgi:transposase